MTKPADDLPQALKAQGITDPTHHDTAAKLQALGMTKDEIIAFILANSAGVLTFARRILDLVQGKPGTTAPGG